MATLADILRQTGYAQNGTLGTSAPVESPMTKVLADHIASLPQKFEENQANQMNLLSQAFPGNTYESMMTQGDPKTFAELGMQVPIAGTVKNIAKPLQDKGLILDVYESAKTPKITLSRIEVPKEMRGQGMGTQALDELTQYADQTGKTVALSPSKDFGATSVDRLKDFYKRFGFVENKGRNKDFSISESMYRLATQPTRKEMIASQLEKIDDPLVDIFHGTSPEAASAIAKRGFNTKKSADGTIWFTENPEIGEVAATGKGAIVKRILDEEKLKLATPEQADKYFIDQLINEGYEGVKYPGYGSGDFTHYQIFNPKKLGKETTRKEKIAQEVEKALK